MAMANTEMTHNINYDRVSYYVKEETRRWNEHIGLHQKRISKSKSTIAMNPKSRHMLEHMRQSSNYQQEQRAITIQNDNTMLIKRLNKISHNGTSGSQFSDCPFGVMKEIREKERREITKEKVKLDGQIKSEQRRKMPLSTNNSQQQSSINQGKKNTKQNVDAFYSKPSKPCKDKQLTKVQKHSDEIEQNINIEDEEEEKQIIRRLSKTLSDLSDLDVSDGETEIVGDDEIFASDDEMIIKDINRKMSSDDSAEEPRTLSTSTMKDTEENESEDILYSDDSYEDEDFEDDDDDDDDGKERRTEDENPSEGLNVEINEKIDKRIHDGIRDGWISKDRNETVDFMEQEKQKNEHKGDPPNEDIYHQTLIDIYDDVDSKLSWECEDNSVSEGEQVDQDIALSSGAEQESDGDQSGEDN